MTDLTLVVGTIRRRWRFAVFIYVIVILAGLATVLALPRAYKTQSLVLLRRSDAALQTTNYPRIDALLAWNRATSIETYVALAQQPGIAASVVQGLGLHVSPAELLTKHVAVTPLTNSDVVQYEVSWPNATDSAAIANEFARTFVKHQQKLASEQASEAAESLDAAISRTRKDLSAADAQLNEFESHYALADGSAQTAVILTAIGDTQSKVRTAEVDRAQAAAQLSNIALQLKSLTPTVNSSKTLGVPPAVDQIKQQLTQQKVRLQLLSKQFTASYPDIVDAKRQIASLQAALRTNPATQVTSSTVDLNPLVSQLQTQVTALRAQLSGDAAQLSQLRSQEAALYAQLRGFPPHLSKLSNLQRQDKTDEATYDALQNSYFNAIVAKNMAVSDVSIIQLADPALAVPSPRLSTSLAVIAVIGLLIALAAASLLDWVRRVGAPRPPVPT